MNTMSPEVREQVTKDAVMECIAESATIAKVYEKHGSLTIQTLLDETSELKDDRDIQIISDYVKKHPEVGLYRIESIDSFNTGLGRSAIVRSPAYSDGHRDIWVGFDGTDTFEWLGDSDGMYKPLTPSQEATLERFNYYCETYNIKESDYVIPTGHSNGGNKVMTLALFSDKYNLIDRVTALCGQGYSPEALENVDPNTAAERIGKITLVSGEMDYVHGQGIGVVDKNNNYIVGYHGEGIDGFLDMLASWHRHEDMFAKKEVIDENGNVTYVYTSDLNEDSNPGILDIGIRQFMAGYMKLPKEEREVSAPGLMAFLQYMFCKEASKDNADAVNHAFISTDGRIVLPKIGPVILDTVAVMANSKDPIAYLLLLKASPILIKVLPMAAFSTIVTSLMESHLNNKYHIDVDYKNELTGKPHPILLNAEAFEALRSRFEVAFSDLKDGSNYAGKAESIHLNNSMTKGINSSVESKTEDVLTIMGIIVEGFRATDKDLKEKAQKIGEEYLGTKIAQGVYNNNTAIVSGSGAVTICAPIPECKDPYTYPDELTKYIDDNKDVLISAFTAQ